MHYANQLEPFAHSVIYEHVYICMHTSNVTLQTHIKKCIEGNEYIYAGHRCTYIVLADHFVCTQLTPGYAWGEFITNTKSTSLL